MRFYEKQTLGINVKSNAGGKEKTFEKTPITVRFHFQNICGGWRLGKDVEATVREKDYRLFRQLKQLRAAIPRTSKDGELSDVSMRF